MTVFCVVNAFTGKLIAIFKKRKNAEAEAVKYGPLNTSVIEMKVQP